MLRSKFNTASTQVTIYANKTKEKVPTKFVRSPLHRGISNVPLLTCDWNVSHQNENLEANYQFKSHFSSHIY